MISNEAVEAYVKQMEHVLAQMSKNGDPYAQGQELFRYFQCFKKHEKHFEAMLEAVRSREALTGLVASLPDEVGTRLPELAALFQFVPPIIWQTIKDVIHDVAKANPIEGGRPELMKDIEAKREICKEILRLFSEGVPLGVSQKRIAERQSISVLKVERIWRERLTLQSAEPRTISDLISAFSGLSRLGK